MAINPNLVGVPAQSKNLDTATTTTTAGLVHRQVISLADPETATSYARVSGGSLQVSVQNATLAVTQSCTFNITNISVTVSLPTGASAATLQTTGNTSLNSIETKTPALSSGHVPDASTLVQSLTDTQLRASAVPVSFTRLASGTDSVTISAASLPLPTGAATESTLAALNNKFNTNSFYNINTNTTSTVKSGAGVLKRIVVNKVGSSSNTCTIYDNTSGTGTIIATIDPVHTQMVFEYDVVFTTGLTIVTATGTAADLTIVYQ